MQFVDRSNWYFQCHDFQDSSAGGKLSIWSCNQDTTLDSPETDFWRARRGTSCRRFRRPGQGHMRCSATAFSFANQKVLPWLWHSFQKLLRNKKTKPGPNYQVYVNGQWWLMPTELTFGSFDSSCSVTVSSFTRFAGGCSTRADSASVLAGVIDSVKSLT